jgi:hypothetical protein
VVKPSLRVARPPIRSQEGASSSFQITHRHDFAGGMSNARYRG